MSDNNITELRELLETYRDNPDDLPPEVSEDFSEPYLHEIWTSQNPAEKIAVILIRALRDRMLVRPDKSASVIACALQHRLDRTIRRDIPTVCTGASAAFVNPPDSDEPILDVHIVLYDPHSDWHIWYETCAPQEACRTKPASRIGMMLATNLQVAECSGLPDDIRDAFDSRVRTALMAQANTDPDGTGTIDDVVALMDRHADAVVHGSALRALIEN